MYIIKLLINLFIIYIYLKTNNKLIRNLDLLDIISIILIICFIVNSIFFLDNISIISIICVFLIILIKKIIEDKLNNKIIIKYNGEEEIINNSYILNNLSKLRIKRIKDILKKYNL